jgi:hypothetical protein
LASDIPAGDGKTANLFLQCVLLIIYVGLLIHPPHCKYSLLNPLYSTGVKHRI